LPRKEQAKIKADFDCPYQGTEGFHDCRKLKRELKKGFTKINNQRIVFLGRIRHSYTLHALLIYINVCVSFLQKMKKLKKKCKIEDNRRSG